MVAKSRNYKFKAKGIRNDVVLHQNFSTSTPDHIMKKLGTILNKREDEWTQEQKRLLKLKIEEKIETAKKQSQYVNKLLAQCKSWGGPVVSIPELEAVMKRHHDKVETVVKTELTYYKHTHRAEVIASPSLFKLIRVSHEERLSSLMVLLSQQALEVSRIPKNSDALKFLRSNDQHTSENTEVSTLECNEACVTLWNESGALKWYVGYCTKVINNDLFEVEHLQRCEKNSNLKWKYPAKPDIQNVALEQILVCSVVGEWNILNNRNSEFTLRNHEAIQKIFSDAL